MSETGLTGSGGVIARRADTSIADPDRSCPHEIAEQQTRAASLPAPDLIDTSITVEIAASGAREHGGSSQVAAAVSEDVRAALPSARVLRLPAAEGSAGFTGEVVRLSGGRMEQVCLMEPRGAATRGQLGLVGSGADLTAVITIEESPAPRHLPPGMRDHTSESSRHAGQLIVAALDRGVRRIIIGCGDIGAHDGGIGMASVLGIRFFDARRSEIAEAGGLLRLASIDMTRRDSRLDEVSIEVIADPGNDLLGERGVTRMHGPRSGASPSQLLRFERGLGRFAEVVQQSLGIDVASLPGGGAAGGLAAGLVAFAGARLTSGVSFLQRCPGFREGLAAADLVIAANDRVEAPLQAFAQRDPAGSVEPGASPEAALDWLARQAEANGPPVIALTGDLLLEPTKSSVDAAVAPRLLTDDLQALEAASRTGTRLRDASAAALRRMLSGLHRTAKPT